MNDEYSVGLLLRDYFAVRALVGILSNSEPIAEGPGETIHVAAAKIAYKYADAMMEEGKEYRFENGG